MADSSQPRLESLFERFLWSTRFCVLLAVIFGLASAVALFVFGSIEIYGVIEKMILGKLDSTGYLVAAIIGAVDLYLIGIVMLIFSFGIYELFISQIDIARANASINILEIKNLDELKNRIVKVVLMVLIVTFFKQIVTIEFSTPLEMLYFAGAIFAICFGVYFMHKSH